MNNITKSIENKDNKGLITMDLTPKDAKVLNLLLDMKKRYVFLSPSQQWIGDTVSCARETANRAIKKLVGMNLIKKRKRGFKFIDSKTDTYLEETCEYSIDKRFIERIKEIHKTEDKNSPFMLALIKQLPALRKYFLAILTVSILSFNNVYLDNNIKTIRSSSQTVFGQDNYEIHKIYEKREILPTTTLPVGDHVMNDHPGNVYKTKYQYTDQYSRIINAKGNHKGGSIDLRNCTETLFQILSPNEKKIAIFYFNGRRVHGSVEKFQRSLQQKNLGHKIWAPKFNTSSLSSEQKKIIAAFPYCIVQFVKNMLKQHPTRRNDFNWILDKCISKCKMDNISIEQLLKKHGYSCKEFQPKKQYSQYVPRQPLSQYKTYESKPVIITKDQATVDKKKIDPKFKFLVGEEIFNTLFKTDK